MATTPTDELTVEQPQSPQFLALVTAACNLRRDTSNNALTRFWRKLCDGEAYVGVPLEHYQALVSALHAYDRATVQATSNRELAIVDAIRRLLRTREGMQGWPLWLRRLREGRGLVGIYVPDNLRLQLRIEAWLDAFDNH